MTGGYLIDDAFIADFIYLLRYRSCTVKEMKGAKTSAPSSSSGSSSSQANKRMRIEVHEESAGAPLLVSFPGGVPAYSLDEMNVVASRLVATKAASAKTRVRVTLDNLQYEGDDFGDNSSKKDVFQYAIGVIRKNDDHLHIYPAGHPFALRTKPKAFVPKAANATMTNLARKENLTQEFGSKKKKSQVRAAKSNLISAENISGAKDLKTMVTDKAPEVDEELLQTAEDVVRRSRIRASRSGKK